MDLCCQSNVSTFSYGFLYTSLQNESLLPPRASGLSSSHHPLCCCTKLRSVRADCPGHIAALLFSPCFCNDAWTKKWQPTPVFLPGEPHGQSTLAGYSPRGYKESDTTGRLTHSLQWWNENGLNTIFFMGLLWRLKWTKCISYLKSQAEGGGRGVQDREHM